MVLLYFCGHCRHAIIHSLKVHACNGSCNLCFLMENHPQAEVFGDAMFVWEIFFVLPLLLGICPKCNTSTGYLDNWGPVSFLKSFKQKFSGVLRQEISALYTLEIRIPWILLWGYLQVKSCSSDWKLYSYQAEFISEFSSLETPFCIFLNRSKHSSSYFWHKSESCYYS